MEQLLWAPGIQPVLTHHSLKETPKGMGHVIIE